MAGAQQFHRGSGCRRVLVALAILTLSFGTGAAQGERSDDAAAVAIQRAIRVELVDGDLRAAITMYEEILARYAAQRPIAAKALLQLGACYEKLGDAQARDVYGRVVREYADQGEAAAEAGSRLAALEARDGSRGAPAGNLEDAVQATSRERLLPRISTEEGAFAALLQLSPDGTRALFLSINPIPFSQTIGVYDYGDGTTTWMTESGSREPGKSIGFSAAWSADGKQVAYSTADPSFRVSKIWVARPGDVPRIVFETDGTVAFVTDWLHDESALVVTLQRADQSVAIGIVSLEDRSFRQLKTLTWPAPTAPKVSPDGRYILFEDGTGDSRDLFVVATDGSSLEPLDEHPAIDTQPLWSPDGRHIVFRSNRQGAESIWGLAVEGGRPAGSPFLVVDRAEGVDLLNWTEGGIAYHRQESLQDIYTATIDPETGEVKTAARMIPYPHTGANFRPRFSPDGRYLAFLTGEFAGRVSRRSLVVLPADGGTPLEVAPPEEAFYLISNIRWRPDSSELSLNSRDRQNRPILLRFSLPEGKWRVDPLPTALWYVYLDWEPSWETFFFYRPPPGGLGAGLFESNIETGEEKLLWGGHPIGPTRALTASPDGQQIAMTILNRIWIFDRATGAARQIPDVAAIPYLSWSPDGRYLLYSGNDEPGTDNAEKEFEPRLRLLDVATGVSKDLRVGEGMLSTGVLAEFEDARLVTPAWAPNGEQIAFGIRATSLRPWLLQNPLARAAKGATARVQR